MTLWRPDPIINGLPILVIPSGVNKEGTHKVGFLQVDPGNGLEIETSGSSI